jgi:Ca2+-binding RTX toxin-like protein
MDPSNGQDVVDGMPKDDNTIGREGCDWLDGNLGNDFVLGSGGDSIISDSAGMTI